MSDADRLREAANRLDRWRERVASSPRLADMVALQTSVFEERGATAALLQAVADMRSALFSGSIHEQGETAAAVVIRAYELADAILGDAS